MIIILFLIYGLLIGSFLNVCIYRIPSRISIVKPPSSCGSCGHRLSFTDMIPVANYITNKGKCRYCGTSYSVQYPLIELLNGLMYVFVYIKLGLTINTVLYGLLISILITLSIIDLKHKIIPDSLNIAGLIIGIIYIIINKGILKSIIGSFIGLVLFLAIAVITNAMGGGDIKLMTVLGLIFGIKGVLFITLFSFILGAVISVGLLILKIQSRKDEIPFGPFISLASLIYIFYGTEIISWYMNVITL